MRRWVWASLVAFAALTSVPVSALADSPAAPAGKGVDTKAEEYMRLGNAAFRKGDWGEAEKQFGAAWAIKHVYDIAGSLGEAELQARHYALAAEHLAFAVEKFPLTGDPVGKSRMQSSLETARKYVESVDLKVIDTKTGAAVDGARVMLDGREIGVTPITTGVFAEQGEHKLTVVVEGYKPGEATLKCAPAHKQTVEIKLELEGIVRNNAIVAVGAAAFIAGAIGTGVFVGLSFAKASDVKDKRTALVSARGNSACADPTLPDCKELEDAGNSRATFSSLALWTGVGTAVVGTGTLIYVLVTHPGKQKGTDEKSQPGGGIQPLASVGPRGGMFGIQGAF